MRVVFAGTTAFGKRCLETLFALSSCEVAGILTGIETFSISYRPEGVKNFLYADLRPLARERGTPVFVMRGKMTDPEIVETVRGWKPDCMLAAGWYHLVPKVLRDLAPAYGLHASLLPDYAGGAPLVWSIINGEKRAGITLFRLDEGVDTGDIVGQAPVPIEHEDTIATLYSKVEDAAVELLAEHLPKLAGGTAKLVKQDAKSRRVMPQRSPEDGVIDWTLPARRVYDFIRAQTRPYPGAFTHHAGRKLTVWSAELPARVAGGRAEAPGQWLDAGEGGILVACGDGTELLVTSVGCAGDEAKPAQDYAKDRGSCDLRFGS